MKLSRDKFEKLALEQIDLLDRIARSLTRNTAAAEDLVQETYLRALKAWEQFDLRSHGIKPWLVRILHNVHATRATRESKQPRATEDQQLDLQPDGSETAIEQWEANEFLDHALDQLSPELRTALLLWAVDGMTYQEIATATDIPVGTVMSRLHRGRQKLKEILDAESNTPNISPRANENE